MESLISTLKDAVAALGNGQLPADNGGAPASEEDWDLAVHNCGVLQLVHQKVEKARGTKVLGELNEGLLTDYSRGQQSGWNPERDLKFLESIIQNGIGFWKTSDKLQIEFPDMTDEDFDERFEVLSDALVTEDYINKLQKVHLRLEEGKVEELRRSLEEARARRRGEGAGAGAAVLGAAVLREQVLAQLDEEMKIDATKIKEQLELAEKLDKKLVDLQKETSELADAFAKENDCILRPAVDNQMKKYFEGLELVTENEKYEKAMHMASRLANAMKELKTTESQAREAFEEAVQRYIGRAVASVQL